MSENTDAPADQPEQSESLPAPEGSNATPVEPVAAPPAPGESLRIRDLGVFEDSPLEYATDADKIAPTASSRTTSPGTAPRRHRGWMAYVVFLVVVVMALLIRFAVFSAPHGASGPAQGAAVKPSPAATATAGLSPTNAPSLAVTPNATLPVDTGGGPVPTPGPEIAFAVTAAEISAAPTTYDGYCDPPDTMIEHFQGNVYVPGTTRGGTITYRWRFSNGTITPAQSALIGPTNRPSFYGAANDQLIEGQWAVAPATADGSSKWAEFEVLSPSHLLSPPTYFTFKCEFMLRTPSASVSGGSGGAPPQYACGAGGDQTFTFTGTIDVFPDPHSHTITYHWLRSDGTRGPDQSVTLGPGVASANAQPDTVVVSHDKAVANCTQYGTQPQWEKIVVTSAPGIEGYPAQYFAWCQS